MTKLSPIESEFATTEEAEAHDAWVSAKVEKALPSTKPRIPHDQVMAETRARIESRNFDRHQVSPPLDEQASLVGKAASRIERPGLGLLALAAT